MGYRPRYDKGDWKTVCDICGRLFKSSELMKRWDGYMVCREDWETRQPQDFVRGVADIQAPVWARPEVADSFELNCTTRTSIAGLAIAGCMLAGNTSNPGPALSGTFTV